MKNIFLTGSTGFVGKNLYNYLKNDYNFTFYQRGSNININQDIVIHLAGKAHDFKKNTNFNEYFINNTSLTIDLFNNFLVSKAKLFIFISSIKAVADSFEGFLDEDTNCNPKTDYGKSKLLAENYILSKEIPTNKSVIILRPAMIHGPENKGNLNQLFKFINKGYPWPFGNYINARSFCSVDNLCFVINEIINNENPVSGIYNIADDDCISTNELIQLIGTVLNRKPIILKVPPLIINLTISFIYFFNKKINKENFYKLTSNFVISNNKIKKLINKPFPIKLKDGLIKTLNSLKIENNIK